MVAFNAETYHGRLRKAKEFAREAGKRSLNRPDFAALNEAQVALREAQMGNASETRKSANAALALKPNRNVRLVSAVALAMSGETGRALTLVADLERDFPSDTLVQNYWLPTTRAEIELTNGDAAKAVEVLQQTAPYELGGSFAALFHLPIVSRGRALLAAGDGAAAAVEFQKILANPTYRQALAGLAHLYLARARVLEAKKLHGPAADSALAQARSAYEKFFTIWKDADPDLRILLQAKEEYKKLQPGP